MNLKKLCFVLSLFFVSTFGFSVDSVLLSLCYEPMTVPKINLTNEKQIKAATAIRLKNMKCFKIGSPTDISLFDESNNLIKAAYVEKVAEYSGEPYTAEKLLVLQESGERADYYGYLRNWHASFIFVIQAIRTQEDYEREEKEGYEQKEDSELDKHLKSILKELSHED